MKSTNHHTAQYRVLSSIQYLSPPKIQTLPSAPCSQTHLHWYWKDWPLTLVLGMWLLWLERASKSRTRNVPFSSVVHDPRVTTERYNWSKDTGLPVLQYVLLSIRHKVSYLSGFRSRLHNTSANCLTWCNKMRTHRSTIKCVQKVCLLVWKSFKIKVKVRVIHVHTMQNIWGWELQPCSYLTLALHGVQWWNSCPRPLIA